MFASYMEGLQKRLNRLNKKITKVFKKAKTLKKKNLKKILAVSTILKLVVLSLMFGAVPALAQTPTPVHVTSNITLALSHDAAVFASAPVQTITMTPGDSNGTIAAKAKRTKATVQSVAIATPDPTPWSIEQLKALYNEAGAKYGVPANLLEAVHQIETGKSTNTAVVSSAHAIGPMQFLIPTFDHYCKLTGEGCNITSVHDSMFAASLLLSSNYHGSWRTALLSYNHSGSYADTVLGIENSII